MSNDNNNQELPPMQVKPTKNMLMAIPDAEFAEMTKGAVAKMSEAEFAAFVASMKRARVRLAVGDDSEQSSEQSSPLGRAAVRFALGDDSKPDVLQPSGWLKRIVIWVGNYVRSLAEVVGFLFVMLWVLLIVASPVLVLKCMFGL